MSPAIIWLSLINWEDVYASINTTRDCSKRGREFNERGSHYQSSPITGVSVIHWWSEINVFLEELLNFRPVIVFASYAALDINTTHIWCLTVFETNYVRNVPSMEYQIIQNNPLLRSRQLMKIHFIYRCSRICLSRSILNACWYFILWADTQDLIWWSMRSNSSILYASKPESKQYKTNERHVKCIR